MWTFVYVNICLCVPQYIVNVNIMTTLNFDAIKSWPAARIQVCTDIKL